VEKSGESSGKGARGGERAGKVAAHVFPNDLERGDAGRHGHYFDRPTATILGTAFIPDSLLQVVRVVDCVLAVRVR
jgi:hypothetical protein